jgi:hypothetical protein
MSSLNNTIIKIMTIDKIKELNIIKPKFQRIIDKQKVKDIVKMQLDFNKKNNFFNFTASGPINIHKWNDQYFLIDGQHRMEALEKLYNDHSHQIKFYIILVTVNSQEELEFNYDMINKNTELPDFSCFQSVDKTVPEYVASIYQEKYPDMWSKNSRSRRPHLFFNYFQESLAFICEKVKITSSKKLEKIINEYNEKLSEWNKSVFNSSDSMYEKAHNSGLYLGLFSHENEEYGYEWAKNIIEEQTGEKIIKTSKILKTKKSIPKKIKNDSWNTYIGNDKSSALCLCCRNTKISMNDFTAGHIISEKNGGIMTVENIVPICNQCNLSMSSKNMDKYIQDHHPKNYDKFINKNYEKEEGLYKKIVNFMN